MQPTVTDGLTWSVGRSVMIMSHAKMAQSIKMAFGVWTWMGQGIMYCAGENGPAENMLGHVHWSIYSKRLRRGHNQYGTDAD